MGGAYGSFQCDVSSLVACLFPPQFAVLMWILTYVGALFNGLTLLILGETGAPCCCCCSSTAQCLIVVSVT